MTRFLARIGLVVATVAVSTGVAHAAKTSEPTPRVTSCAFGRLPPALRSFLPRDLARRERHYVSKVPKTDRARAGAAFSTAAAGYLFAMPSVLERATVAKYPANIITAVAAFATPESRTVVAPNHDTFYFVSHIDLRKGPYLLDSPATDGRYSVVQLLDGNTDVVGYLGSGKDRDRAQHVAILPPGWKGTLPAEVTAMRSPTNLVWLLGRTLVDDEADVPAARKVMSSYALTPLDAWRGGLRTPPLVLDQFPGAIARPVLPTGLAFLDAMAAGLAEEPARKADACALRAFTGAGIAAGRTPSAIADPVRGHALAAGVAAGDKLVDDAAGALRRTSRSRHNGWWVNGGDVAEFGTDYAKRAVIARIALASNRPSETLYPTTDVDTKGRRLNGAHRYLVRFAPGQMPPARAFWSLTLYDPDLFLSENQIDRYAIGDRTPGLRYGPHGSLTIRVQNKPPAGAEAANWLPAPEGRFSLYLRLYEPKKAATDGRWLPPRVTRVGP